MFQRSELLAAVAVEGHQLSDNISKNSNNVKTETTKNVALRQNKYEVLWRKVMEQGWKKTTNRLVDGIKDTVRLNPRKMTDFVPVIYE